jgi:uncharacterized membrane-anchored protein
LGFGTTYTSLAFLTVIVALVALASFNAIGVGRGRAAAGDA